MLFSLVIPCYNEAKNLPLLVERCSEFQKYPGCEVIFVDNGSVDETQEVLAKLLPKYNCFRAIRVEQNQGYGFGILCGLREARGDILGWTHADMQTDPLDALQGLDLFEQHGANIFVKGHRYGRPLGDVAFTVGMSIFESLLLRKWMFDINAQPTIFSRVFFESWGGPPHDFSLDLFAYYQALRSELIVKRFPVRFGERANGVSHWNINWVAKYKFIRRTLEYSLQLKKHL